MRRYVSKFSTLCFLLLSACGLTRCTPNPVDQATTADLYRPGLPTAETPLSVYFIGHSLVGRDMPAMLAQLAGAGHSYESQMGWGAELQAHWGDETLDGADTENDHPRFREAHEAVDSGDYDIIVLTEKIGIKESIKYHHSWDYLSRWAQKAAAANPDVRLYLYETWHPLDVPEGWLNRLDQDLERFWEREIIDRALASDRVDRPIYVIPGGQVMARFARTLEAQGGAGTVTKIEDLFTDNIHFNDLGAYLMALTHYAVIYGRTPLGLPYDLHNAKGQPALSPGPEAARLMQQVVWDVVAGYQRTGVRGN